MFPPSTHPGSLVFYLFNTCTPTHPHGYTQSHTYIHAQYCAKHCGSLKSQRDYILAGSRRQNMNNNICRLKLIQITQQYQGHKWRDVEFGQEKIPEGGLFQSDQKDDLLGGQDRGQKIQEQGWKHCCLQQAIPWDNLNLIFRDLRSSKHQVFSMRKVGL